jgi:hypothetical protein
LIHDIAIVTVIGAIVTRTPTSNSRSALLIPSLVLDATITACPLGAQALCIRLVTITNIHSIHSPIILPATPGTSTGHRPSTGIRIATTTPSPAHRRHGSALRFLQVTVPRPRGVSLRGACACACSGAGAGLSRRRQRQRPASGHQLLQVRLLVAPLPRAAAAGTEGSEACILCDGARLLALGLGVEGGLALTLLALLLERQRRREASFCSGFALVT